MGRENIGTFDMVTCISGNIMSFMEGENRIEEPNLEDRRFFDMLDASKHLIYGDCREDYLPL